MIEPIGAISEEGNEANRHAVQRIGRAHAAGGLGVVHIAKDLNYTAALP